ncbi:sigma-54-dependent transcriptional regulator [Halorhodospira halophila]|uniref:DNA-binding transcriptional regulator NtrC n=1 Tax=Halorhodospira halophila (strain DSM 244 / SL1) TaxID=349124 RepID=A1WZN3_HALHL|nr:sigma-54 dependent transcriptional regulator [Halorhodospira halophila]ABM63145.1 two component, sigma54 specific, transcriptional regulator, Fis family [Halorhodospira halophila SL1]MBK1729324.1 sigma-54-dependent Fis family transcriptional regulator [Halorhodospira halophila]
MRGCVLVVDDHREVVYAVRRLLQSRGLEVISAPSAAEAEPLVPRADALILDIQLEQDNGLALLQRLRSAGDETPAVVLSAHTFPDNVVEASKRGAMQILAKPIEAEALVGAVEEALSQTHSDASASALSAEAHDVLGTSAAMMEVFKALGVAAANDLNVLLTGETGVGKEVSAELVHRHSHRADGPFVAINCTAMPESLLEAELFGHASGAFTGASRAAEGKVEAAAGGTLFLDEIGDMPLAFQAKLLRFLEDKRFYRLGESAPRHADVRVIAATNRQLLGADASQFRSDLYYRLAQIPVHIPPLRDRLEDVPALIEVFIRAANQEMGLDIHGITPEVRQQAQGHSWPGNVRELKNAVYRAAAKRQRGLIDTLELAGAAAEPAGDSDFDTALDRALDRALAQDRLPELLNDLERRAVQRALTHYNGNKSRVAEALNVSRNTLRARLQAMQEPTD